MVVTKEYIQNLREGAWMNIDKNLEEYLLAEYGEEPFPHEWSEQDLYEQIRKIVIDYKSSKVTSEELPF